MGRDGRVSKRETSGSPEKTKRGGATEVGMTILHPISKFYSAVCQLFTEQSAVCGSALPAEWM